MTITTERVTAFATLLTLVFVGYQSFQMRQAIRQQALSSLQVVQVDACANALDSVYLVRRTYLFRGDIVPLAELLEFDPQSVLDLNQKSEDTGSKNELRQNSYALDENLSVMYRPLFRLNLYSDRDTRQEIGELIQEIYNIGSYNSYAVKKWGEELRKPLFEGGPQSFLENIAVAAKSDNTLKDFLGFVDKFDELSDKLEKKCERVMTGKEAGLL